jgi:hypothetical protein
VLAERPTVNEKDRETVTGDPIVDPAVSNFDGLPLQMVVGLRFGHQVTFGSDQLPKAVIASPLSLSIGPCLLHLSALSLSRYLGQRYRRAAT